MRVGECKASCVRTDFLRRESADGALRFDEQKLVSLLENAEYGREYFFDGVCMEGNLLPDGLAVRLEKCLTSTNTVLKEESELYPDRDILLIAEKQTAGRGRMGRSFQSPEESGIYMSLLLHPTFSAEKALFITTAAATAVSEAIDGLCGVSTGIKWVNDIFLNGKKICGILTETKAYAAGDRLKCAILGIGINLEMPKDGFREGVGNIAGAIYENGKSPKGLKNKLIARAAGLFYSYYKDIEDGKDFFEEYKKRSCVLGKEIRVIDNISEPGKSEIATALDIDEKCRLTVRCQDGTIKKLSTGEISIKMS